MRKLLLIATAALALAATAAGARAGADECYARTYDQAHLARHPDQLVTSVSLRFRRSPHWFMVRFTLRGRDKPVESAGVCRGGHCYVECEGGGLDYERTASGLVMRLDRIRVAECGKELTDDGTSPEVSGGIDDRVFRLDRVTCE